MRHFARPAAGKDAEEGRLGRDCVAFSESHPVAAFGARVDHRMADISARNSVLAKKGTSKGRSAMM
jgi:hypothetical protein